MQRRLLIAVFALASVMLAQRPEFEVASIKQNVSGTTRGFMGMQNAGTFEAQNMSLKSLIMEAYNVKPFQIVGGPSWVESDKFDVAAKPGANGLPDKTPPQQVMKHFDQMLQPLLEERFQLKVRRETKELPIYNLVVAKGGLKLTKADCLTFNADGPKLAPPPGGGRPRYCGNIGMSSNNGLRVMDAYGVTIPDLIGRMLPNLVSRMVIDKTELTEVYNIHLEWSPDLAPDTPASPDSPPPPAESRGPSIFSAMQEQLGLKLEAAKGPVGVLVIEHVEKLSAN